MGQVITACVCAWRDGVLTGVCFSLSSPNQFNPGFDINQSSSSQRSVDTVAEMNILVQRRPPTIPPFLFPPVLSILPQITRRHEASARRTTKRLRTKPDPSFTSSIPPQNRQDHIVFNPPSSAPSPYHTPAVFLPPNDPRRTLLAKSHHYANPYQDPERRLPPPVRKPYEKKYHLTEKEILNIRKLRSENPHLWTRKILAEHFKCSQFFVGMICEASNDKKAEEERTLSAVKDHWGKRRRYAREDRQKRRELWGRDQ